MNASMYIELKKNKQFLSFFLLSCEEFSGDINLVYLYKNAMQNLLVQKYHFLYKLSYSYYRQKEENSKQVVFTLKKCTDKHKIIIFTLFRVHQCKMCKI